MKILFKIGLFFFAVTAITAGDEQDLAFADKVKSTIREQLKEGKMVYVYEDGILKKRWRNENLSALEILSLMKAYNEAVNLERQINLRKKLELNNYIFTEYPEKIIPMRPPSKTSNKSK